MNNFPHGGSSYNQVLVTILRENPHSWDVPVSTLIEATDGSDMAYSMDCVNRQLFTLEEAESIKKNMLQIFGEDIIAGVEIREIPLPVCKNTVPCDFLGYGDHSGCLDFYKDKRWKSIPVWGFYDMMQFVMFQAFYFGADGSVSGAVDLNNDEMRKLVGAYQKAIETGEETNYVKKINPSPSRPVMASWHSDFNNKLYN